MQANELVAETVWEGVTPTFMARMQGSTGGNLVQASLSSIACQVRDISLSSTAAPVFSSTALTIASVVFDTLQTDSRWTKDATGYNFRHTLGSSVLATGSHTYRAEYKFVEPSTGSGGVSKAVFRVFAKNSLMD